jgi:exopolysaccharide biosynthesis protein
MRLLFALVLTLLPLTVRAAELRDVAVETSSHHIDVLLKFDAVPAYSETFRYSPDRYVLTFAKTKSAVPQASRDKLAALPGRLLTRVSIAASGADTAVGFYLNLPDAPLVRKVEGGYSVRFYLNAQQRRELQLAPGITFVEKLHTGSNGNLSLQYVRIKRGASADIYSVAADRYDGKTRLRSPSSFARKEAADAVINGGFFGAKGQHLSTLVVDGVTLATGVYPTRPMLVVTEAGEVRLGRFNVQTLLLFGGKSLTISAKNYPFESGKTIVYDSGYPLDTLPQSGMYYYKLAGGKLQFHGADTKGLALGSGQMLLATDIMPEANPLRQIPDGSEVKVETRISDEAGTRLTARSVVGGAPMLVEAGAVNLSNFDDRVKDDIARSVRSRTAAALTGDGSLLLAVVREDEAAHYGGVSLEALAKLLIAEGAQTAINLDGGGSSALVIAGVSLNVPESGQRPVSNVIVVKARPVVKTTGR